MTTSRTGSTEIVKTSAEGGLELEVTFRIKGEDAIWFWTYAYLAGLDAHTVAWMAAGDMAERIAEDPIVRKLRNVYLSHHRKKEGVS